MGKNVMISVRIPTSLVEELKESVKKDHFLDLSEAVRSIIRDKYTEGKDPQAHELRRLRKEIASNIDKKNQAELIVELKKIRDSILKNGQ